MAKDTSLGKNSIDRDVTTVINPSNHPVDTSLSGADSLTVKDPQVGDEETPLPPRMAIITFALILSTFLAAVDVTIITTALPSIAASLHASQSGYSWIGSGYLLTFATLTPFWGKLSDVFGRKPVLLVSCVIFLIGSLICGLANSVAMLLAGRTIQGAGGGGLVVLVQITIGDLVSMRKRSKYMSILGMVWAFASTIGPVIGGVLVEKTTWRWIFYLNLPCGGAAFLALLFFLKVHNPRTKLLDGLAAIDWLGTFLVAAATLMLLLGLQYGSITYPWNSVVVVCLIVFSVAIYAVFIVVEWKVAKYPLIPLRLLKRSDRIAVLTFASCSGFALVAVTYFLPFYFQNALGASPIQSAVWILPLALALPIMSIITGLYIMRTGRYLELIIAGSVVATLGTGLFIYLPASKDWVRMVSFQIVTAVGLGAIFQAPLVVMQSKVEPADKAAATSMYIFLRGLCSAISVVVGGVIIQNRMQSYTSQLEEAGIPEAVIAQLVSAAGGSIRTLELLTPSQRQLATSAITDSVSKMWIFFTCILFVGLLVSPAIGVTKLSKTHEEYKTGLDTEEKNRLANVRKVHGEVSLERGENLELGNRAKVDSKGV